MKKYSKEEIKELLMVHFMYIKPLEDIVQTLKDNIYRDTDMEFLNGKLELYTKVAMKGIGKDYDLPQTAIGGILNPENKDRFLTDFTILLNYFKSLDSDK